MNATLSEAPDAPRESISVSELMHQRDVAATMRIVAGEAGIERRIDHPRIQKSGLVLAGHTHGIVPTRVQILGETEFSYLDQLDSPTRKERLRGFLGLAPALVVVTRGVEPFPELLQTARETDTPLAVARPRSSRAIQVVHWVLDRALAPRHRLHGVLIDIHGIGTLLVGPSGIGKSECALFLLERGHRLVADDQVVLTRLPPQQIWGQAPELLRGHLELRGIGIVNVRDLFGSPAVRERKLVQLVIELCRVEESEKEGFDRLGLDDRTMEILDVSLPHLRIPVRPGRNMAVILEVAARNHLLKRTGRHAARDFVYSVERALLDGHDDDEPE